MDLETKADGLPTLPGVYLMKADDGRVLYVGKAKNLRVRVRSYFRAGGDGRPQIRFLMARVADIDWLVTDSEKEALILENNLIKKHRPRYNISLRDDKTYLSLRISVQEPFPRLDAVRRVRRDGALYFGPYSSAVDLRATLDLLLRLFPLRQCSGRLFRERARACLYHRTRNCPAPCVGKISREEYRQRVEEIVLFLKGRNTELKSRLEHEMKLAAAHQRYEEAALLRDRLRAVEATLERQKAVARDGADRDVVGLAREGSEAQLAVLVVRAGALVGQRGYFLNDLVDEDADVLAEFLRRYYTEDRIIPPEILLPVSLGEDAGPLRDLLSETRGGAVNLKNPRRGEFAEMVTLAESNAREMLAERRKSKVGFEIALAELAARLSLPAPPRRIECFDISNFQGRDAVASMAVFTDGFADKASYRRFAIRTVEGSDDFAMLYEAVTRRLARRGDPAWALPDLLLIDGGLGQVSSVKTALDDAGVTLPVVGIAKERTLPGTGAEIIKSRERLFLPGRRNPILLHKNSSALFLLQRLRDEAHRFAVEYHRKRRAKRVATSELDALPGIGRQRKAALLKKFGSVRGLRAATREELAATPGLSAPLAEKLFSFLHPAPEQKS